jgi:2-polyprenyl-3-methyl-5-hydroxy-6-metoxy-1,4-benzoquinol methylase
MNKLHITNVEHQQHPKTPVVNRSVRRQEIQATMERMWLNDAEQFNPERDSVQRKRVSHTLMTVKKYLDLNDKRCVDLGCGSGVITRLLRDANSKVDAVDIANLALERLKAHDMRHITPIQDCLPSSRLEDNAYDLVVCTELIGYLDPKEYRLLFAELARLVKKEGYVACSSSLDIHSENALERFSALAETEFEIEEWVLGYHLLWIKGCHFLEAPAHFIRASQDAFERNQEIGKRKALNKWWFRFNSTRPMALFWRGVNLLASPLAKGLRQSDALVNILEKVTKLIWDESGISHALFIGNRRPLTFPLPKNEIPIERKHKREVWE